jgi:hypothetical protein
LDATISLVVDGVAVNSQSLRLACGQKKPLVIPLSIREPGQHVVQVKLSPDSLSVDDSRTAVLTVKEKLSVLLVGQSEQKTAAFRIALGIAPEVFSVTSGTLSSIVQGGTRALNAFDVVVLCNLPAITPAAVSLLERFTRDGGGLAVLHGSAADEYAWNSNAERLLDYRLDIASPFGDYSIDPQEYSSPLSEAFREFPDAGLVTTPIFRYWKISQSDPSSAGRAVLLRTSAGDPLVLQGENGAGRVISMFSCPELGTATDAWNAVAAWPSFVPVFHALVRQAAPGDRAANLDIGDTLLWNLPLEQSRVPVIIQRPDSTQDTALAAANSAESGSSELVYAKINLPGVYTAKIAANPTASGAVEGRVSATDAPVQYFAAQFTANESDLATVPLDQLPTEDVSVDDSAESDFGAGATDRNDFGVSLIWVVAALMICESILAWFFGSRLR